MTTEYPAQLPTTLRRALGPNWDFETDGTGLRIMYRRRGAPYCPPRRPPDWSELLGRIEAGFAACGVDRQPPLPLRWGRDTDFVISAVQALDPYLKDRKPFVYREGYLAQPVVRFTGKRDASGQLQGGFLTSFVNISRVQRIANVPEHAAILDEWVGVLSGLGFHARHLTMTGNMATWHRDSVSGITLHISHAGMPIGDVVLLWNADDPKYLVSDLGSGLERLRWALTCGDWQQLIYGGMAGRDPNTLDALRTATLIVGSGIQPGNRGAAGALRRLLRTVPACAVEFGTSRAVREAHQYWSSVAGPMVPWHQIAQDIEGELLRP